MSTEKQFASVPTLMKGMFRMVADKNSPQLCTGLVSTSNSNLREEMLSNSRQPDVVLRFLIEMDRKLDAVLGHMQRGTLEHDFPLEGRIVEISGDSLILECKEPLAPGDHMELLLLLEEYPLNLTSVIANVEQVHNSKAITGRPNTAFQMRYACLREEDREAIIRFVFREERRRIRQQKSDNWIE